MLCRSKKDDVKRNVVSLALGERFARFSRTHPSALATALSSSLLPLPYRVVSNHPRSFSLVLFFATFPFPEPLFPPSTSRPCSHFKNLIQPYFPWPSRKKLRIFVRSNCQIRLTRPEWGKTRPRERVRSRAIVGVSRATLRESRRKHLNLLSFRFSRGASFARFP